MFFLNLDIAYDSEEAKNVNKLIFETIYFGALEASQELAKEKGVYSFKGSPLSEGKFQFDLWNAKPSDMWDWETLREKNKKRWCKKLSYNSLYANSFNRYNFR